MGIVGRVAIAIAFIAGSITSAAVAIGEPPAATEADVISLLSRHKTVLVEMDVEVAPFSVGLPGITSQLRSGRNSLAEQYQGLQGRRSHFHPTNFTSLAKGYEHAIRVYDLASDLFSHASEHIDNARTTGRSMRDNADALLKALQGVSIKSQLLYSVATNLQTSREPLSSFKSFLKKLDLFVRQQQLEGQNAYQQLENLKMQQPNAELTQRISLQENLLRMEALPYLKAREYHDNLEVIFEGLDLIWNQQKSALTFSTAGHD